MDIQELTSTGSKWKDFNLLLLENSGGAWFVFLGAIIAQEAAAMMTRRVVLPAVSMAMESGAGKNATSTLASALRKNAWLLGPAMIAATQLLRNRSRGLSGTEAALLKHGKSDLEVRDRLLRVGKDGDVDTAYEIATTSLSRLQDHSAAELVEPRLALKSSTRNALLHAFAGREDLMTIILRQSLRKPTDKPVEIAASDLLMIAMLVKDELGIEIPDKFDESFSQEALMKLVGSSRKAAVSGWVVKNDLDSFAAVSGVISAAEKIRREVENAPVEALDKAKVAEEVEKSKVGLDILIQDDDIERAIDVGFEMLEYQDSESNELAERSASEYGFCETTESLQTYRTHLEDNARLAGLKNVPKSKQRAAQKEATKMVKAARQPEARSARRSSFLLNLDKLLTLTSNREMIAAALRDVSILKALGEDRIQDEEKLGAMTGVQKHTISTKAWKK